MTSLWVAQRPSSKSNADLKGAQSSSLAARGIATPMPGISLVAPGEMEPLGRNGHCLPHQGKVAGLQFLHLPALKQNLEDTLDPQGYRASSQQVGDASWALLWGGKSSIWITHFWFKWSTRDPQGQAHQCPLLRKAASVSASREQSEMRMPISEHLSPL